MSLSDEQRDILVNYRIEKAYRDFDDALYLAKDSRFDSAANKLYYAAFHIVSALLLSQCVETRTHHGIQMKFGEFAKQTGKVSREEAILYARLFEKRQKGDYTDVFYLQAEDVVPYIEPTKAFLAKIEALIRDLS